jgi:arginine-tRNA-protein transferase
LAKRRGIPYVYLGFWIAGHPKMDYKRRFRPLEIRRHGRWIEMP